MPEIHARETAYPGEREGCGRGRQWYAVYTRSRHEKKACRALGERNVETFLPLRETLSRWKDRMKKVIVPLFPGYLFVRIGLGERLSVLHARGVVGIVGNRGVPVPVPGAEIEAARMLLRSGIDYSPYPYAEEGREVYVRCGPLQGVTGRVSSVRGGFRLILSVHLIKRSVSVEVDAGDVEPL